MIRAALVPLFLVAGCSFSGLKPYYAGRWDPPEVSGLSDSSEDGNVGGGVIEIRGSGFREDARELVVLFGDHNAEILDVSDDTIRVRVPGGPITGGPVEVRVATWSGYASAPEPYTYDVGEVFEEEHGYVLVNNYWDSCYGGASERINEEWGQEICVPPAYIGYTGIDGRAELYDFAYPRVHSEYIGFWLSPGTDLGEEEWSVERPGQLSYTFGLEDLRKDIGPVTLHNEFWEGETWCADLSGDAAWRYGGGYEDAPQPTTFYGAGVDGKAGECGDDGGIQYDVSRLEFCTSEQAPGVPSDVYRADWAVGENFFAAHRSKLKPVDITMDALDVGLEGQPLALPEGLVVYNDEGFLPATSASTGGEDLWSVISPMTCFDDDGDGEDLRDVAFDFRWLPSDVDYTETGAVLGHQTYVRATFSVVLYNWFGLSDWPVRVVAMVPDEHEVDDEGYSHLTMPAEVAWQIPTVRAPAGRSFDPTEPDLGYFIVSFERVTDYAIETERDGVVVLSYATGDFGFNEWTNPGELNGCQNCLDDDRDGWSDEDDPDCDGTTTEETGLGTTACNDGIDNDGDGDEDSADELCTSATDGDESNCSDRRDNDEDGLDDDDDPECVAGMNEGWSCSNGDDDDGDGWTDTRDPDCQESRDESGYGTSECNDGLDNDGDTTVDNGDPDCRDAGDTESDPDTGGDSGG